MKKVSSLFILILALGLTSCSNKEKAVKEFLHTLATAMSEGQTSTISSLYPGAEICEDFKADLLLSEKIEMSEVDDSHLLVKLEGADVALEEKEDGSFVVTASHGLFDFSEDKLSFAEATGWIESGMNDLEQAERFADTDFEDYLLEKFVKNVRSKVSIRITGSSGDDYYGDMWVSARNLIATVTNKNDFELPGSAYTAVFRSWYWGDPSQKQSKSSQGVNVPANGSAKISNSIGCNTESDNDVRINFNDDALRQIFYENYTPTGTEYNDYLDNK